ncbi:MAG TPA: hypothetical protein PK264_20930, partial [Hyphomicrobiaceae bacterium]|nr:hypothetical protein [Hyphomicrobiaceae bacterium]
MVIIVANESYAAPVPKVEYALRDAEAMQKAAREVLAVPPERIIVLRNLTHAGLAAWFGTAGEGGPELERLKSRLTRTSTITFFYSGHGMPARRSQASEAEAFLLPVDTTPALAARFGIAVSDIRKALLAAQRARSPEGQVVIYLD